jgi:hypothetical protein
VGAAIEINATTAGGRPIHTFRHPLTLAITYDAAGLSPAEQRRLLIAVFDSGGRRWTNLRTTLDAGSHALTAAVGHLSVFQVRRLSAAALRIAWPPAANGKPAQAAVVGGRAEACPSVAALRALIAANARRHARNDFGPPYPAGCLWVPIQLTDAALAPQFAGALAVARVTFRGSSRVGSGTLDGTGGAVAVLAVPFSPGAHDRVAGYAGPAAVADVVVVVTDRWGVRQPPALAHVVVMSRR